LAAAARAGAVGRRPSAGITAQIWRSLSDHGLGLALSRFLAERFSARLLLTARSAPTQEALAAIQELERLGSQVLVMPAAAEDADAMLAALDAARARFGVLDGVIHAAGVPGTGTIALRKQDGEVSAVLAPKLETGWPCS
jgi:NAD(P)-dependent dehydrogenase (short-subunit alcohol dehydrogenase family)